MILSLLIIALCFAQLLRETDYLRIRLITGAIPEVDTTLRKSWADLEVFANRLPDKYKPFWMKFPDNMSPLCGWEWLHNTMHAIPEYKITLTSDGLKETMTIAPDDNGIKILRDVLKTYHKSRKPRQLKKLKPVLNNV